jgi:hypothetical protein
VAEACASAAIAWNQLNQNRNLVCDYRITTRELGIIRGHGHPGVNVAAAPDPAPRP